jgi:hypothetical protein
MHHDTIPQNVPDARRSRFCYNYSDVIMLAEWILKEWTFSIYLILPVSIGLRVYSASYINEYQKQRKKVSGEQNVTGA